MDRKKFLGSILATGAAVKTLGSPASPANETADEASATANLPPYLKINDRIGITSPAGYISIEDIQPAVLKMKEWGYDIVIGATIGKRDFTFGGTDEERRIDLQKMLDDPGIKAIMCARGGYGAVRIIDQLDFSGFRKHPKWIIGFSDITVIHSHLQRRYNIATIHSKMCNSFPSDWLLAEPIQKDTIESIRQCLAGEKMQYAAAFNEANKPGSATGQLVGGNLKTLESLGASDSDIITKNKILFVEDTGEYLYSIDRMFWNLKRSGKLSKLAGLIVGGFKIKKEDAGDEFGKTIEQIVLEKIKEYNYPVCFDFPVGHQKNNYALKCGVVHHLEVTTINSLLTST
ncbi:MAG: peptidase [Ferruginibacter sp.]|nr:peptidase [Ferruginibacter sp.]